MIFLSVEFSGIKYILKVPNATITNIHLHNFFHLVKLKLYTH